MLGRLRLYLQVGAVVRLNARGSRTCERVDDHDLLVAFCCPFPHTVQLELGYRCRIVFGNIVNSSDCFEVRYAAGRRPLARALDL